MRQIDSDGIRAVLGDVLPCLAMVVIEGCIIALTIMASTAMAHGMSPYVFVVYTNVLGSIILLLYTFSCDTDSSRSQGPFLSMAFLVRVFVLGFLGITISQNLGFLGLSYSSPIVACGMANQVPAMSFIVGIILRSTKFDWRSSTTQARLIGTFVSLSGAIALTLYKGPSIKSHQSPSISFLSLPQRLFIFSSTHENWILGCILYAASSFTVTVWNIFQVGTVRMCPQVMKIISFYSLSGTVQSAVLAMFLERDPNAWKLGFNFELLVIVLTAIFGSLIRSKVQIWCTKSKGPHFVPLFKPFGIPYASTFGCVLFAETFHYGSMMAAFICGVGYYTVLWGQIKEEETHKSDLIGNNKISSPAYDETKEPLLLQEDDDGYSRV